MTTARERLLTDPLFYDALSGEFTPPFDAQHQRTLGRIAYDCFLNGKHVKDRSVTPPLHFRRYMPSWARLITAGVEIDTGAYGAEAPALSSISLRDATDKHLLLVANEGAKIFIGTLEGNMELELELGDKLDQARAAVTDAAQHFFDNAILL